MPPPSTDAVGTMSGAVIDSFSGPSALQVRDLPVPHPRADEVRVAVATVGANHLDVHTMNGRGPGSSTPLPHVVGIDPAGVVVEIGAHVDPALIGRRIVVKPNISCGRCPECRRSDDANCRRQQIVGVHRAGGAAHHVVVPISNVVDIGDLDFAVATASIHTVPVALHAWRALGGVRPGSTVLVTGATGAVGGAAVATAVALGARVVAVSGSVDVTADGVLPLQVADPDALPAGVEALVDDGIDLALDTTGDARIAAAAFRTLGWGGRLALVAASRPTTLHLDTREMYMRRTTVMGCASASHADVRDALAMVRAGEVAVPVASRHPLDRISDAYEALARRGRVGKVVVDVA